MTPEQALALLDTLLGKQKLKDIQELVFRYSWQGWSYPQIAEHAGYETGHIRDVGSQLWQQLTQACGERVTKKNLQAVLRRVHQKQGMAATAEVEIAINQRLAETAKAIDTLVGSHRHHWQEAIDVTVFYGRSQELDLLEQWIIQDRCRLVAVLGMGGIGKTALVAKLAQQLQGEFEYLIWQSLRNAPPIEEILAKLLPILSEQQENALPETLEAQVSKLLEYLRSSRCLLVLDNIEAILSSSDASKSPYSTQYGQYREGYEGYGELIRRVGIERHLSCLVLTSREKPKTLMPLEGETLPVRSLSLKGLSALEVPEIFRANGCHSESETHWHRLTQLYSGNPLALKIVSTTVRDLFDGSIAGFLEQGAIAFGDIITLLNEQFQRLSELEKQVMYWLAINREWTKLAELQEDFISIPSQSKLLDALLSLRQRALIENNHGLFTLQPVVMEYVTEQLIDRVYEEIESQELALSISHALTKAQAKDYIRESQIRVILGPLVARLISKFRSRKDVEYQLNQILFRLRSEFPTLVGYAGGNIINLLRHLQLDLSGYDFSRLSIWQAYLVGATLHQVNFAYTDLSQSVFTGVLDRTLSVAFSPDGRFLAIGNADYKVRV